MRIHIALLGRARSILTTYEMCNLVTDREMGGFKQVYETGV